MDAAAQVAAGFRRHVLSADEFSEGDDGIGDEFRMLDELRGVAGNSRDQDLSGGEFHVGPDFVFMLVTDVS